MIPNYEQRVYAGVLGKVIGVYMGRPFEGWQRDALEAKWGLVERYVHEDQGVPLVVSDDDISGTFTFPRALEDSGLYADTPAAAFGEAWLNYVAEGLNIFWWGGAGTSTEHTAYLRLKQGYTAPDSGSIALNGQVVAEQIGAQIFIDGFGLVAPGDPALAARLAMHAASVSHDGEAVYAAQVVAAMVSAAFVETDMSRLLDIGVQCIPADCLIARLHRDVRAWVAADGDWRRTHDRIMAEYGPSKFWGGPHVVPNHALMVMAWAYAPDDFQRALAIVNTSGLDTDCNSGNVGAVMGVKVGLAGINAQYDFQSPFADRMLLPTAEGTRGVSDCLTEALHLARLGRRVMGWPDAPAPKDGARYHFSQPGACHGFMNEDDAFESRGTAWAGNPDGTALRIIAEDLSRGHTARVSTPLLCVEEGKSGPYAHMGTPRLYPGMTVTLTGSTDAVEGDAQAVLFLRHFGRTALTYGEPVTLSPYEVVTLTLAVPDADGLPVTALGIELRGVNRATADLDVDHIAFAGVPRFTLPDHLPLAGATVPGWISTLRYVSHFNFVTQDGPPMTELCHDLGPGVLVTGTTDWADYTFAADLCLHMADAAGLIVRYQGLRRYLALVQRGGKLQLVRQYHGETVLAEIPHTWATDAFHRLAVTCHGAHITATLDGAPLFSVKEPALPHGGAGFLCDMGKIGFRAAAVTDG